MPAYYEIEPQGPSTLKQIAVIVPCFVLGCVGALALTAPQNAAVQNRVIPAQAATAVGATVAAATLAQPAMAVSDVQTFDYRNIRDGYNIIYEARDEDLPIGVRDGLDQARDVKVAKARVAEANTRLNGISAAISKAYWVEGREELRRFVGTLRFDINTLAATSGSPAAKAKILEAKKNLFSDIEKLDFAMRSKDQKTAAKYHAAVVKEMAAFL